VEEIFMADHPLSGTEFLAIGFGRRDASLTVLDSASYSVRNDGDAVYDAHEAGAAARGSLTKAQASRWIDDTAKAAPGDFFATITGISAVGRQD
jgi:hypothetical protein